MADNPCTHCGGSGREPDPLEDAARDLGNTLNVIVSDPKVRDVLHVKALALSATAARELMARDSRITFLEAALRDILGRFDKPLQGLMQIWRAPNEDVENWRAILDGTPGILTADGRHYARPDETTCPGGC